MIRAQHITCMYSDRINAARANAGTIIKLMHVPTYRTTMSLKDYIQRLIDWNVAMPSMTECQKQQLVLESLSKNTNRVDERDHLDVNTTRLAEVKTVNKIIEILKERFELSDNQ